MCVCVFVFLFKQKTAYEMRISDWSSDVCSSDLGGVDRPVRRRQQRDTVGVGVGGRGQDDRRAGTAVRADQVAVAEGDGSLSERVRLLVGGQRPPGGHDGRVGKTDALLELAFLLVQGGEEHRVSSDESRGGQEGGRRLRFRG